MKAKDIYTKSPYFRKMRKYAESHEDLWFILSAEHHLLDPEDIIEPYNTYLGSFSKDEIIFWGSKVISDLSKVVDKTDCVELIAGKDYIEPIISQLQDMVDSVSCPLSGKRIGEKMSWWPYR